MLLLEEETIDSLTDSTERKLKFGDISAIFSENYDIDVAVKNTF